MLQAVPSQCCVCMRPLPPTAQMSVDPIAAIPRREMVPPFAFIDGADTFDHLVPSQCSMMSVTLGLVWPATAQTLFVARAVTPNSSFTPGLEITDQLAPSQCSISECRGLKVPPFPASPTAQMSLPATPDMERRWLS